MSWKLRNRLYVLPKTLDGELKFCMRYYCLHLILFHFLMTCTLVLVCSSNFTVFLLILFPFDDLLQTDSKFDYCLSKRWRLTLLVKILRSEPKCSCLKALFAFYQAFWPNDSCHSVTRLPVAWKNHVLLKLISLFFSRTPVCQSNLS